MDKAGHEYWQSNWARNSNHAFQPHAKNVSKYGHRQIDHLLQKVLGELDDGSIIMEVGCADSEILTYIASLGYQVAGIDYSMIGCQKIRERLLELGVEPKVTCCDVFEPPKNLIASCDAAISFGLAEHFTDTHSIVDAISNLVRPGGYILTLIPNMNGSVGLVQRLVSSEIYSVHEPLTPADLRSAHERANLEVLEADYLLPSGFGVVNYGERDNTPGYDLKRFLVAALARLSWITWAIDEKLLRLPRTGMFSPYCYCIARRQ